QRFPDLYPPRSAKERLMAVGYHFTLREYRRLATVLFGQTAAFGSLISPGPVELLPPAGRVLEPPPDIRRLPHRVIYAGANGPQDGVEVAVAAMADVVRSFPDAELVLVLRPAEQPERVPPYCRVVTASGETLEPWLWSSSVGLVPRRHTRYFRVILPVKIFDYMAHGLAQVVTHESESASFVETLGIGLGAPDTPSGFADAILRLLNDPTRREAMAARSLRAVADQHNWPARARDVLHHLGLGRRE
ncbi:MAG: glycosyltransferase, partial [Clostridia bacterium]